MLTDLLRKIATALETSPSEGPSSADLERVSAVLLVEIARADHVIDDRERNAIESAMRKVSTLPPSELQSVLDEAFEEADVTVSLHDQISLINEHFDKHSKLVLVEQMWRVAMADGNIDKYEEYTIRKLCDLLFIKHRDFMRTKLKVVDA